MTHPWMPQVDLRDGARVSTQVAVSEEERARAETELMGELGGEQAAGGDSTSHSEELVRLEGSLRRVSLRGLDELAHLAWVKRQVAAAVTAHVDVVSPPAGPQGVVLPMQEGYLYGRARSRYFDTPTCGNSPVRPKTYKVNTPSNAHTSMQTVKLSFA
jgi:hypothetical protein